jgi:hypothetical protein
MLLEPGSLVLLLCNGEQGPAFSLSEGETLRLYAPDGTEQDAVLCAAAADCSQIRSEDSGFTILRTDTERGLLTADSAPNLYNNIFRVIGILRQKQHRKLLLKSLPLRAKLRQLCHDKSAHIIVKLLVIHCLSILDFTDDSAVFPKLFHHRSHGSVLLVHTLPSAHISEHIRIAEH